LVFKLAINFGLSYGVAEAEVEASRHERWPASFKSVFISECATDPDENKKQFYQVYCQCIADKIEDAQIIATKYNPTKDSDDAYADRTASEVGTYLSTVEGKASVDECTKKGESLTK
jgi:hypothetical protein